MLKPEVRKVADEFYKRYEDKMKRPPAGHASAGFSAIWALFTEVLPKAKTYEPDELREIALKLDLPEGSLVNGSGIKFTNFDWPDDPKDAGQNLRAVDRRVAVDQGRQRAGLPGEAGDRAAGHGAVAGVEQALARPHRWAFAPVPSPPSSVPRNDHASDNSSSPEFSSAASTR